MDCGNTCSHASLLMKLADDVQEGNLGAPPWRCGSCGATVALTAQPAAGAQQASGWTTVTDDPATWPRDCGPVICVESDNNWCHTRVTSNARRLCEGGGLRGWKWHQWPSLLAPPGESREQGECRKHSHDRYSPLSPPAGMRALLGEVESDLAAAVQNSNPNTDVGELVRRALARLRSEGRA